MAAFTAAKSCPKSFFFQSGAMVQAATGATLDPLQKQKLEGEAEILQQHLGVTAWGCLVLISRKHKS